MRLFLSKLKFKARAVELGQGVVEYGLILSLVAIVAVGGLAALGPTLEDQFKQISSSLDGQHDQTTTNNRPGGSTSTSTVPDNSKVDLSSEDTSNYVDENGKEWTFDRWEETTDKYGNKTYEAIYTGVNLLKKDSANLEEISLQKEKADVYCDQIEGNPFNEDKTLILSGYIKVGSDYSISSSEAFAFVFEMGKTGSSDRTCYKDLYVPWNGVYDEWIYFEKPITCCPSSAVSGQANWVGQTEADWYRLRYYAWWGSFSYKDLKLEVGTEATEYVG